MRTDLLIATGAGTLIGYLLAQLRLSRHAERPKYSPADEIDTEGRLPTSIIAQIFCVIGALGVATFAFLAEFAKPIGHAILSVTPRTLVTAATACMWLGAMAFCTAAIVQARKLIHPHQNKSGTP